MRRISTLKTIAFTAAFAAAALFNNNASAQKFRGKVDCPIVTITFDNANGGGSLNGFIAVPDFALAGAKGNNANSDYDLQSTPVKDGLKKTLYSPTFSSPVTGFVDYSFELSGSAKVVSYTVSLVKATDVASQIALIKDTAVTYSNNGPARICGGVKFEGNLPKQDMRYKFTFTVIKENNGDLNSTLIFDNFGSLFFENAQEIALPVNFKKVNARKEAKTVKVQVDVADEVDVKEYQIERSVDGKAFTKVGTVAASGADTYTFSDVAPVSGVSYYRVRSVDIDGKSKLSTIVRINLDQNITLRAFPSPASTQVAIEHEILSASGQITLTTAEGKVITKVNALEGTSQTVLDLSHLNSGIYLVRLQKANGQAESLKFVKL